MTPKSAARSVRSLGGVAILAVSSFAASGAASPADVEETTEQVACETAEGIPAREARLERLRASIDAAARAAPPPEVLSIKPGGSDPRAQLRLARVREVGQRVAGFEEPLARVFEELRAVASQVVERRSRLDGEEPTERRERLARVSLRWADTDAWMSDPDSPLSHSLTLGCGRSLLRDEGWISRDWQQIVVCPGFLLLEAERGAGSSEHAADSSAFLLAHELGHAIEMSANDPATEAAADAWGNEIFAEYVAVRVARGDDARSLTARALGSFCDLEADGLHGLGTERAESAARAVSARMSR